MQTFVKWTPIERCNQDIPHSSKLNFIALFSFEKSMVNNKQTKNLYWSALEMLEISQLINVFVDWRK